MDIIIAITAASGAIYARQVVDYAIADEKVNSIALIFSNDAEDVVEYEGEQIASHPKITLYRNDDLFAPCASGSCLYDAMVIVPCSMGTMGRIAAGFSDTLITRTADVMLKERRKLIIVARETPLSLIHLRAMTTLTECGAIVMPASPSFYASPTSIETLAATLSSRVAQMTGITCEVKRWEGR
ncbi:MAG: UbiX family flavin prenyltransferase [Rikenellaceae bacterium]